MKWAACLLGVLFLCGCGGENRELAEAIAFRETLLSGEGCRFSADLTADYGDSLSEFSMDCRGDRSGTLTFEITQPESISGIRGSISDSGGTIRFEEDALYFPLMTDDLLTPAAAPWIFLKSLRGGCITSVCREEDLLHLTVDDSFEDDALTLDIWFREGMPVRGEILHDGRRILCLDVKNFVIS